MTVKVHLRQASLPSLSTTFLIPSSSTSLSLVFLQISDVSILTKCSDNKQKILHFLQWFQL